jgi:hypothetical protein
VFENKIFAQPGVSYQRFGHKITTNHNLVAVGTSVTGPDSKVFLFEEVTSNSSTSSSSGWKQRGFVSSLNMKNDGFGSAMAMDDSVLVVGAPLDDTAGFSSGLVYVFSVASSTATDSFDAKTKASQVLSAPVTQKGASFGSALCMLDGTLVVGSPGAATETGPSSGIVYIYEVDDKG